MDFGTVYDALDFFRHRWTIEILDSLAERPKGFNELQRSVNAVHATSFNQALQRLIDYGLVSRPSTSARGRRYRLTPFGERALPMVVSFVSELDAWREAQAGQDAATRSAS